VTLLHSKETSPVTTALDFGKPDAIPALIDPTSLQAYKSASLQAIIAPAVAWSFPDNQYLHPCKKNSHETATLASYYRILLSKFPSFEAQQNVQQR